MNQERRRSSKRARAAISFPEASNSVRSTKALGTPFVEDTECTTVSGAVVELFGRLPSAGEKIEHQGVSVEVLEADRRKVRRLRMTVPTAPRT